MFPSNNLDVVAHRNVEPYLNSNSAMDTQSNAWNVSTIQLWPIPRAPNRCPTSCVVNYGREKPSLKGKTPKPLGEGPSPFHRPHAQCGGTSDFSGNLNPIPSFLSRAKSAVSNLCRF